MKILRNLSLSVAVAALFLSGCSTMTRSQQGAAIGAGGGAAVGAGVGKIAGNTAVGAVIGATVGGVVGAIIGKQMDKQAEEIKKTVPSAKVERVEEKIIVEFTSAVLFGFDQATITPQAQNTLNDLILILNKYPDTDLEIDGHTDNTGKADYNQKLSERRAGNVAGYLTSNGIAIERISTKGYGFSMPKYDNNTADGRAGNRRVEFIITANDKMKSDAEKQANN
ncbi:MAG TPA: OmpA family protein [Niabella sp.]|jgi:outer membrane protein OmpA-like peptidoglycan-associated protein|nr:OmpA family protein [Chitinophagaceae bacterium]HRN49296.1 OmpA family protein [Niabella sp.]HRO84980.1 OmpA family protein [Niabella sp.]